ncbi:NADH-ubiquinone oxidoreductase subunit, mitochondrial [Neolecta irregularis DAH-3]|uniref:NADH-ubiquinone oxidoreductase 78 kDa subunit, mitochondrial n=1 Tax=Neolecta irregularis (strain DAH-3) TaxID=1198029 RepID=A0A1U7LT68_NEOID|nr:NADH-ubiquinone oxidoreductase subunit, mitochondrial [Neolecta irregularis DAH-3]|eukprot:OLL25857.1 NADH-ubiquinone oxidoreductase subunit, mitochondrial [Neolecta irregularis DAH-3]
MVEQGLALIQACEQAGVSIPRYCYHEKLNIAGNCRMCLVEMERSAKPVASCAMPVMPGMKIKTNTPLVHKAREGVMEFLLANHPLDCPICDQGGECDLQDQSMRYGSDRGRFHEITGKRAVEDRDLGPLVKTTMTRCIHCTRCVRFANEVAGAPELGTTGRGNDMQIGTYLERSLDTELSGNVIDLCPVGALTSKPYAFKARPWELKGVESIDIHDAMGSNIRIDSRGVEVMRVLPRLNDDINEEWINDKTRFANDGLKTQRLTTPLLRHGDRFEPASWAQALSTIAENYEKLRPSGNETKAIAGHLADAESMVALKDLINKLGSENLAIDQPQGNIPLAHGVDIRSNYCFNSQFVGVEEADVILLVGTNPRHEASVLNARIRKTWLRKDLKIGFIGESAPLTYDYENLGMDAMALQKALAGPFGKTLGGAKTPMIIIGSAVSEHPDAQSIFDLVGQFVSKNEKRFITEEWNGYNILQRVASRTAAYDIGFVPASPKISSTTPKMIWLLNADEISPNDVPKDAFVIYQGHHGDNGAQYADVILPGSAYTEKSCTYVNSEGRSQITRAAVSPPGVARNDWSIIRAASEYLNKTAAHPVILPYDNINALRDRMADIAPHLIEYDVIEPVALPAIGIKALVSQNVGSKPSSRPLSKAISDFYMTDVISRNSKTMGKCSVQWTKSEVESAKNEASFSS